MTEADLQTYVLDVGQGDCTLIAVAPVAAVSAHRPAGLVVHSSGNRFAKLTLVAANSAIWLYVTAALGLAA